MVKAEYRSRDFSSSGGMSMDILGEILKQVLEGAAQQQAPQQRAPQPQQRAPQPQGGGQGGPQGMPNVNDLQDIFTQIFGGGQAQKLPDVVKQFEEKGLRDEVDSWVRTGPNKPVDRRQIEDVFGQRELEEIARQRNIDRERLAEVLSRYIP
ncbi:MAG: YidB family protein, partial [Planctomycetia bacterium]